MKKNKLKFLDKGNYFEIGDITDEGVKILGRFMELTTKRNARAGAATNIR